MCHKFILEVVELYKYLENIIDNKLKINLNVSRIHTRSSGIV